MVDFSSLRLTEPRSARGRSASDRLQYDEDQDRPTKTSAEQEVQQGPAGGGEYRGKNNSNHRFVSCSFPNVPRRSQFVTGVNYGW